MIADDLIAFLILFLASVLVVSNPILLPRMSCPWSCPTRDSKTLPLAANISGLVPEPGHGHYLFCYYPELFTCLYNMVCPFCRPSFLCIILIAVGFTQNTTLLISIGHKVNCTDKLLAVPCDDNPSDCCPRTLAGGNATLYEEGVGTYGNITDDIILQCPYLQSSSQLINTTDYCKYEHVGATFSSMSLMLLMFSSQTNGTLMEDANSGSCLAHASNATAETSCPSGTPPPSTSSSMTSTSSSLAIITTLNFSPSVPPASASQTSALTSEASPTASSGPADSNTAQRTTLIGLSVVAVVAGAFMVLSLVLFRRNRRIRQQPNRSPPTPTTPYPLYDQLPNDSQSPETRPLTLMDADRVTYSPRGVELSFNGPQTTESLKNANPTQTISRHPSNRDTPPVASTSSVHLATLPHLSPRPSQVRASRSASPEAFPASPRYPLISISPPPEEQASSYDMGPQVEALRLELLLRAPQSNVPNPPLYSE